MKRTKVVIFRQHWWRANYYETIALVRVDGGWTEGHIRSMFDDFRKDRGRDLYESKSVREVESDKYTDIREFIAYLVKGQRCEVVPHEEINF